MEAAPNSNSRILRITRLPSSALLESSVQSRLAQGVRLITIHLQKDQEIQFVKEWRSLAHDLLKENVCWTLSRSQDDLEKLILFVAPLPTAAAVPEAVPVAGDQPSHSALSTTQTLEYKLSKIFQSVAPFFARPSNVSRLKCVVSMADSSKIGSEKFSCFERIAITKGQEHEFLNLCRSELQGLREPEPESELLPTRPDTPEHGKRTDEETTPSPWKAAGVKVRAFQDTASSHEFTVIYSYGDENALDALRRTPFWREWRRLIAPMLAGVPNVSHGMKLACSSLDEEAIYPPIASSETGARRRLSMEYDSVSPKETKTATSVRSVGSRAAELDARFVGFESFIDSRFAKFETAKAGLIATTVVNGKPCLSLEDVANSYQHFGLLRDSRKGVAGWLMREWFGSELLSVCLFGDFNGWNRDTHPLTKVDAKLFGPGVWEIFLADDDLQRLTHRSKVKLSIKRDTETASVDRVPSWTKVAWESPESKVMDGVVWCPPENESHHWSHPKPTVTGSPRIYEVHIGGSSPGHNVGTYVEFRDKMLPRISAQGFNTVLIHGIQEHANYASAGWHVTSYFAVTSRFGTPEEFKSLVDSAHKLDLQVVISLIHSHASPDAASGLAQFDGSPTGGFFQTEPHKIWDAQTFDLKNQGVLRFLLSNVKFFVDEYKLDGLWFAGVGSLLYKHHGIMMELDRDDLNTSFNFDCDENSASYLQMATSVCPGMCFAADSTEYPGLSLPILDGGLGFTHTLSHRQPGETLNALQCADRTDWSLSQWVKCFEKRSLAEKTICCLETMETNMFAKRPMKVAMFAWETLHTHAVGGVAPHVTEMAAGLARLGHEIHIFTRALGSGSAHSTHYGVHYHECPFQLNRDFVVEMQNMCNSFISHLVQTEDFMKEKFHVCHAHDWLAAKALITAKSMGRLCIQTIHSTEYGRCGNKAYGGESARIRAIEQEACNFADRVICVSGVLAEEVQRQYGVHADKLKVVYNGCNVQNFDGFEEAAPMKAAMGVGAMDPTFLFVGRLAVQKGPDLLIEAVPHVLKARGDAKFVIVGDGYMKPDLVRRAEQLKIMHAVKFLGAKSGGELIKIFKACDAVIVPSRNEPFGIVVLEAWSAFKPVVATTCGGPRDFVSPNVDGFLVDPEPGSIAWGCCEILNNFEHARWMGERGRVKAAYSFSWDTISQQTRDIYFEQMSKSDGPYSEQPRGDCSLAQRILGPSLYDHMTIFDNDDAAKHGLTLLRCAMLMTLGLGGEGFLNFMGSEFAHPDKFDFPHGKNGFSHFYCRRNWALGSDIGLKFKHQSLFTSVLMRLASILGWQSTQHQFVCVCNEEDKVVAFERGECLFVVNFHPYKSFEDYRIGNSLAKDLTLVLDTDELRFGGWGRLEGGGRFPTYPDCMEPLHNREKSAKFYLPSRCGLMLVSNATFKSKISDACAILNQSPDDFVGALPAYAEGACE